MPAAGIAALIKTARRAPQPCPASSAGGFLPTRCWPARPVRWRSTESSALGSIVIRGIPDGLASMRSVSPGISAHAVLEEHSPSADGTNPGPQARWETEAILLGAADRGAWIARASGLIDWLSREPNLAVSLKDLAFTLNARDRARPHRVGLVVKSPAELRDRLQAVVKRLSDPKCQAIRDARGTYFGTSFP